MNNSLSRNITIYAGKALLLKSMALFRLFSHKPIVLVDQDGITYDPLSLWFVHLKMSITWAEIRNIYLQDLTIQSNNRAKKFRLLCINPKDVDAFAEHNHLMGKNRFASLGLMVASDALFTIPEETIQPHSLDTLFSQICDTFKNEIQSNAITIGEKQEKVLS